MTMNIPPVTDWGCKLDQQAIEALDPVVKARSEALAWNVLAALCAWRIGVAPVTVRPCAARCRFGGSSWLAASTMGGHTDGLPVHRIGSFTPHLTGGNWVNSCGCWGSDDCACGNVDEVILPGPVGGIVEVKIDGDVVPASEYRVDNGNRLVNLNPSARHWPICQDNLAGDDEVGSFVVTYYRGAAPNEMISYAAGLLAYEFYQSCKGGKCRLPSNVTNIVRNGVTIAVSANLFLDGDTGIPEVNAVIKIYNPNRLTQQPRVVSPDGGRRARTSTWTHA